MRMYFKEGKVKVELGLARGKAQRDKRETIKQREADQRCSGRSGTRMRDKRFPVAGRRFPVGNLCLVPGAWCLVPTHD